MTPLSSAASKTAPSVSLIIATYNWKESLQLVLETALKQTKLPNEIVIADDGSREDTAEMIRTISKNTTVPILHIWQPDEGFRLARSRNNAIAASSGGYLIFLDGDCFLNPHFIEDHLSFAKPGQYVVGTRINLLPKRQEYVFRTRDCHISVFSWGTHKKLNAIRSRFLSKFHVKGGMAGANFAVWREDIVRINGFNEIFQGHGGEDGEISLRLDNRGLARRKMVHLGLAYHLAHPDHPQGDRSFVNRILGETIHEKKIWCEMGLDRAIKELSTITNSK